MPGVETGNDADTAPEPRRQKRFRLGELVIDTGTREVSRSGQIVKLPALSYDLLVTLASVAPDMLTHEELIERVWGGRVVSAETVTQRVMLVRQSLGDNASSPRYIAAIRGQGYRMLESPEELPSRESAGGSYRGGRAVGPARTERRDGTLRNAHIAAIAVLSVALLLFASREVTETAVEEPTALTASEVRSVAILPLQNQGALDDDSFLADSIHNDILTTLARSDSLRVVSRTSVERFRDTDKTIGEIGRELRVDSVLEGVVQRAGDRLRINVQLIDTSTDKHLWADSFDEELTVTNILAVQREIASSIARSMQALLSAEDQNGVAGRPTENVAAYEAYLRGAELLRRRTGATIEAAISYFKEAVRHDPEFAAAHVGLADGYQLLPGYGGRPAAEAFPLALEAAETALDLDPYNGAAHASLAMVYFEAKRYRDSAVPNRDPEPLFVHAIELSPNYATGHQWYGEYLASAGRLEEAVSRYRRAAELDPLSPILHHVYAHALMSMGRRAEAEERFHQAIEIDPAFARAYQGLGALYFAVGRLSDAALATRQAATLNSTDAATFALLSNIYIHLGDDAEAAKWLEEANRLQPDSILSRRATTVLHLYRKEYAAAADVALSSLALFPHDSMFFNVVKNHYLNEGKTEYAVRLYETLFPDFFRTEGPKVDEGTFWFAVDCSRVLQEAGRHAEARVMLQRAEQILDGHPARSHYQLHVLRAAIHALNSDTRPALESLQQAIDMGWRRYAFYYLDQDPNFDNIRGEPEFRSIETEMRAELAAQLQEVRARVRPD